MDRKEYLYRLILGLEDGIARAKMTLPHYKPDDVEGHYAKKFLASMEENLAKSREELAALDKADPA